MRSGSIQSELNVYFSQCSALNIGTHPFPLLQELERAESEKAEINNERIAAMAAKEAILKERNSASAEHSSLMEERRQLQLERERLVGEKRVVQAECDTLAAERDEVMERLSREQLAQQEAVIQTQEMRLTFDSLKAEVGGGHTARSYVSHMTVTC